MRTQFTSHTCLFAHIVAGAILISSLGSSASAAIFLDPPEDTFNIGGVQYDIASASSALNVAGDGIIYTLTFFGPNVPASRGISGFIDIDSDQNPLTGEVEPAVWRSHLDQFGAGAPPPGLGVEFFVDLFDQFTPGFVDIVRTLDNSVTGTVPITFTTSGFTLTVPLSALGGDDGNVDFGVIVGNLDSPTDQAPNNDSGVIPEPSSLVIFGLGLACVAVRWRVGRRRHVS